MSNPLSFTSPMVSGNATATATITPAIQALLYGAAGPKVSLTTGLDFSADTTKKPWWTLTAPLNIDGSLVAPILGLSTGNIPLHHSSFTLKTADGPFNGVATVNITNPGSQTGAIGSPVSVHIEASDSDRGALGYSATGLPPGLKINAGTGLISGTPTAAGASRVTVIAKDASGPSTSASFTWTIRATPPIAGVVGPWPSDVTFNDGYGARPTLTPMPGGGYLGRFYSPSHPNTVYLAAMTTDSIPTRGLILHWPLNAGSSANVDGITFGPDNTAYFISRT